MTDSNVIISASVLLLDENNIIFLGKKGNQKRIKFLRLYIVMRGVFLIVKNFSSLTVKVLIKGIDVK